LQDNPDVEGNQREIKRHKKELVDYNERLESELKELKYENFALYDTLRAEEKELNFKIKKVIDDERKAKDETTKQTHEDN
jgi:hypothetical protein